MKKLFFIFVLPLSLLAQQDFKIEPLDGHVNTFGAELNFIQINDTLAFYTSFQDEVSYQSSIYFTTKRNEKWGKGKYSRYNSELFDTGDISFLNDDIIAFTLCDVQNNCQLVSLVNGRFIKIEALEKLGKKNIQSHITAHNNQSVIYFVSDREGGFGGLDIWLSVIDINGNFGVPINAGSRINSSADEITPFYNHFENQLYFSSNRKKGRGGFDIYKSEGKFNLWKFAENTKQFNTKADEMYLTFFNENTGYFSSNRKGAKYESREFCCNDIFSFEIIEIDTIPPEVNWVDFEPLELYFHNDEPDCCTLKTTTNQTYKDAYISYFKLVDEYKNQNDSLNNFFETTLKPNYNRLINLLGMLSLELDGGKKIELQIRGFASPLHKFEYNINLSQRRIQSMINYISTYRNTLLSKYLKTGQLSIVELPLGESKVSENTSDNPHDIKNSIYSLEAIKERKIEIVKVILKD
ncbi:hypothetical protein N9322_00395 [bacterium]|nr:hypothetical protein [bacterium]